jgi:hypothetical protein
LGDWLLVDGCSATAFHAIGADDLGFAGELQAFTRNML